MVLMLAHFMSAALLGYLKVVIFILESVCQIVQGSLQTALTSPVVTPVLAPPYYSEAVIFCETTPGHNHTMERLESGALQGVLP